MEQKEEKNREETINYITRFLTKLGYFELINDHQKMNEFIESLTPEQFKNLLVTFNSMLREISTREKSFYQNGKMIVDNWIAPSIEVREQLLPELLESLKQLESNEERAALLYYSLLDLHMFSDGNGRTARFFYNLISGTTNLMDDIDWYIHNKRNNPTYSGNFEITKGIMLVEYLNWYASWGLRANLKNYSIELDPRMKDMSIETYGSGMVQDYDCVAIPEDIQSQLTEDEIYNINTILLDRSGYYTVGGITMLIMASKKNQLENWIAENEKNIAMVKEKYPREAPQREKRFIFSIGSDEAVFNDWTLDDYKEVIKIGNDLKHAQLKEVMNIFTNHQEYTFSDGTPIIEEVLPQLKKHSTSSK